jgi:ribosomal RNA-processing protein 7
MTAKVFAGYHALALPLPHSSFRRFIYAKQHDAKPTGTSSNNTESILAAGRTAYLVNLPAGASEDWLRACLESVGPIQHVVGGSEGLFIEEDVDDIATVDNVATRTAHVVFKAEESLKKMLQVDTLETPAPGLVRGLQAYAAKYRHNRPGLSVVKELADRYMAQFDELEAEDLHRREELKNQVDDDGFQTVVNTKKRGIVQTEEVVARPAKKHKSKELGNFYRFQTREKKRDRTWLVKRRGRVEAVRLIRSFFNDFCVMQS